MSNIETHWREKGKISKNQLIANEFEDHGLENFSLEPSVNEKFIATIESGQIPGGLSLCENFVKNKGTDGVEEVYEWYSQAIQRRKREPLEGDRFIRHFFEGGSLDATYMYGDQDRGYLLGYVKNGAFIPTHFAPRNMRKGYDLIKELGENEEIPVLIMITEDLVKTIEKMPEWHVADLSFLAPFNAELVQKQLVYNSHPKIKNILEKFMEEYKNYSDQRNEWNNDNEDE